MFQFEIGSCTLQTGWFPMIAFDLNCKNGHCFEGWFEDGAAYDHQKKRGLISCPVCDSIDVSKKPTAFTIKGSRQSLPAKKIDLEKIGKKIIDYVNTNFDNVGADFAEEALKMHYGVTEPRNIRGVSTPQEEASLKDEGVQFFKFPAPPDPSDTDS